MAGPPWRGWIFPTQTPEIRETTDEKLAVHVRMDGVGFGPLDDARGRAEVA